MEDLSLYFTDPAGEDMHSGSPTLGSKSIPLGIARNIGVGSKKVFLKVIVTAALTTGGKTLGVDLITDSAAGLATSMVIVKAGLILIPALAAIGATFYAELPEADTYKAFLGIQTDGHSDPPGAGNIKAFLTLEPGVHRIYPTTSLV